MWDLSAYLLELTWSRHQPSADVGEFSPGCIDAKVVQVLEALSGSWLVRCISSETQTGDSWIPPPTTCSKRGMCRSSPASVGLNRGMTPTNRPRAFFLLMESSEESLAASPTPIPLLECWAGPWEPGCQTLVCCHWLSDPGPLYLLSLCSECFSSPLRRVKF